MGLQRYRADEAETPCENGSVAWYAKWIGGASLALIRNCPIRNLGNDIAPRTVYVTGEPDTWFSQPAKCKIKGKTITGYVTTCDDGWEFRAHTDQAGKL